MDKCIINFDQVSEEHLVGFTLRAAWGDGEGRGKLDNFFITLGIHMVWE